MIIDNLFQPPSTTIWMQIPASVVLGLAKDAVPIDLVDHSIGLFQAAGAGERLKAR